MKMWIVVGFGVLLLMGCKPMAPRKAAEQPKLGPKMQYVRDNNCKVTGIEQDTPMLDDNGKVFGNNGWDVYICQNHVAVVINHSDPDWKPDKAAPPEADWGDPLTDGSGPWKIPPKAGYTTYIHHPPVKKRKPLSLGFRFTDAEIKKMIEPPAPSCTNGVEPWDVVDLPNGGQRWNCTPKSMNGGDGDFQVLGQLTPKPDMPADKCVGFDGKNNVPLDCSPNASDEAPKWKSGMPACLSTDHYISQEECSRSIFLDNDPRNGLKDILVCSKLGEVQGEMVLACK